MRARIWVSVRARVSSADLDTVHHDLQLYQRAGRGRLVRVRG